MVPTKSCCIFANVQHFAHSTGKCLDWVRFIASFASQESFQLFAPISRVCHAQQGYHELHVDKAETAHCFRWGQFTLQTVSVDNSRSKKFTFKTLYFCTKPSSNSNPFVSVSIKFAKVPTIGSTSQAKENIVYKFEHLRPN